MPHPHEAAPPDHRNAATAVVTIARDAVLTVVLDRFGDVDAFSAEDRPLGRPRPGQIRVEVRAIGFNPVDSKARQGALGGTPPLVLGRDVSGVVTAVGDEGTGFTVGDAVYARASEGYAESVVPPAALAARMPATLSFAQGRRSRTSKASSSQASHEAWLGRASLQLPLTIASSSATCWSTLPSRAGP